MDDIDTQLAKISEQVDLIGDYVYIPGVGAFDSFDYGEIEVSGKNLRISRMDDELIQETDEPIFHIGKTYREQSPAKAIQCRLCNGTQFNVGVEYCFTAIKCVKCGWELCIHEG